MVTFSLPTWPDTALTRLLSLELPIVQAPMAGATTPELVAAVSNRGGLGSLAAATLAPAQIEAQVLQIRTLTSRPFAINLFALEPTRSPPDDVLTQALERLAPFHAELGITPRPVTRWAETFTEQLATVRALAPAVVSVTFGVLSASEVAALHAVGSRVIGTATNVAEAIAWEAVGADAVCAQGSEAGGHRGTFLGAFEDSLIGTIALVPRLVDAVRIPVLAAGGIMDGRGIAAARMLGASGVQLGTAFLTCPESSATAAWKSALRRGEPTRVTRAFSGRPARGVVNAFMERLAQDEARLPSYPIQNALTAELRAVATREQQSDYMSLWSGQAGSLARELGAAELMTRLDEESRACLGMREASHGT